MPDKNGLYPGEDQYFQTNRNVAGMATPDGRVVVNPYKPMTKREADSVRQNEGWRQGMFRLGISPAFQPTALQRLQFQGTPYAGDEGAMRQTIIARLLSGDPSGGVATPDERSFMTWLKGKMQARDGLRRLKGR